MKLYSILRNSQKERWMQVVAHDFIIHLDLTPGFDG